MTCAYYYTTQKRMNIINIYLFFVVIIETASTGKAIYAFYTMYIVITTVGCNNPRGTIITMFITHNAHTVDVDVAHVKRRL